MSAQRRTALLAVLSLALLTGLVACDSKPEAPGAMVMDQHEYERWEIALVEMRIEKNDAFRVPATTPLPENMIEGFEGLNYYLPAPQLRFRTPFLAAAGTDTVRLTKRKGNVVPYVRRGTVAFAHEGGVHELAVFGPTTAGAEDYLWLPFFDKTSSTETYPGGRYLDLTVDADGYVDLDFNYAYNPLCDYNADRYNCTLPPLENTLGFEVVSGEKRFSVGH